MQKTKQARSQPLWATGPAEILNHGLFLLKNDNDSSRRLAMISIDNAVELMIKTFLGLPSRINGLKISRSEYNDISESFPKLLDALENHAKDKIIGIDLGEIEWFHRLRNQLYHQGNGLTVERDKVEVYAQLANVFFENLFGIPLFEANKSSLDLLGSFMEAWIAFEKTVNEMPNPLGKIASPMSRIRNLEKDNRLSKEELEQLEKIRTTRNEIVHGKKEYKELLSLAMINQLKLITSKLLSKPTS